jgi:hypothetical protein
MKQVHNEIEETFPFISVSFRQIQTFMFINFACLFSLYFAFCSLVLNESDTSLTSSSTQQRIILNEVDENSITTPLIDEARTNISSSIGPATASTPSPSSAHHSKPTSLTSSQTYLKTIQQPNSSPILQAKTIIHDNDNESTTILTRSRTSSMKHGEKKDIIATVRFKGNTSNENGTSYEETYL